MPVLSVSDEIKVCFLDEFVDDWDDLSAIVFRWAMRQRQTSTDEVVLNVDDDKRAFGHCFLMFIETNAVFGLFLRGE